MTTTAHSTNPSLAEIATAQAAGPVFAFDRLTLPRELTRLQRLYAAKLAQHDALAYLFDEAHPDVVLQVPSQTLTLRLGEAVTGIYPILRDALDQELRALERNIVETHLAIERDEQARAQRPAPKPDQSEYYVPRILELCQPAAPHSVHLVTEQSTAHDLAA